MVLLRDGLLVSFWNQAEDKETTRTLFTHQAKCSFPYNSVVFTFQVSKINITTLNGID